MPIKVQGTKTPASGAKASGELSRAEQDSILRLVNEEKRAQKKPPMAMKYMVVRPPVEKPPVAAKYMVVRPDPKPPMTVKYMVVRPPVEKPPVAAKYMVVRPNPEPKPPIVARYLVVPTPFVAKYAIVPPWAGIDAHQAVINNATKNGKVSLAEATTIAKLFNRDIAHADKEGRNIRPDVAKFLKTALEGVWMTDKSEKVLFGEGGPGYVPAKPQPCYIMAPRKNDKPNKHDGPIYILPPTKKTDGPIYILPPKPNKR